MLHTTIRLAAMPAVTGISPCRSYEPVLLGGLTPSWVPCAGEKAKTPLHDALDCRAGRRRLSLRSPSGGFRAFPSAIPVRGSQRTKLPLWLLYV